MPSEKLPDLCYSHWLSFNWCEGQRENVDNVEGPPFQGAPFSQFHAKCLSPAAFSPVLFSVSFASCCLKSCLC